MKKNPFILLGAAGLFLIVAGIVGIKFVSKSRPSLTQAMAPSSTPKPTEKSETLPFYPVPSPTPSAAPVASVASSFVSESTLLQHPPSVVELNLQPGDGGSQKATSLLGVAFSREGKVVTLASFFDGKTSVASSSSAESSVRFQGWLARDNPGPWIILKMDAQNFRPAQVVAASALAFKAGDLLAIPTPTSETPNAAQTVLTIASPEGPSLKTSDELFWISGSSQVLKLGAPVVDRAGSLAGLIDQIGTNSITARVRKITVPLPIMDAAASRTEPLSWTLTVPPNAIEDVQPFTDPSISPETIQHLAQLSGEPLTHALDAFLQQHASSPLAWSLASMGYARAGKASYAVASAQMLTKAAPHQWQAWYLYGRQLEANRQFSQAADAYQQAVEANAPQDVIGLPLAASLFKAGNHLLAMDKLQSLVRMHPDYYDAWLTLGEMQRNQYLWAEATHTYMRVLTLNPQSITNWEILAGIYDQLHNPQGAIECYTQLTQLVPDNPDIWYNLGLALLKANLPDAARTCLTQTLNLRPGDDGAKGLLARLDAAPSRTQALLEKLRTALAALPADNLVDYSSIKNKPIDGKWEDHNLHFVFRYGDVRFRDSVDGAETDSPKADTVPVLADHSAFLSLTVAPIRNSSQICTQRFDLAPSIPGFALYVYYADHGDTVAAAGHKSAPSQGEKNFYRTIEKELSQLSTQLTAN